MEREELEILIHYCPTEIELCDDKYLNRFQINQAVIPAPYVIPCCDTESTGRESA